MFFFRGFCPRLLGQLAGEIRDEFFVFAINLDKERYGSSGGLGADDAGFCCSTFFCVAGDGT